MYPVLLHSTKKEKEVKSVDILRGEEDEDGHGLESGLGSTEIPLLQLTLIEQLQTDSATSSSILKYVALRYVRAVCCVLCAVCCVLCNPPFHPLLLIFLSLSLADCRVMPLAMEVESATLQLLFSDLIADLKFVDRAQTMASKSPSLWIDEFNMRLMSPGDRNMLVDVYRFESLVMIGMMSLISIKIADFLPSYRCLMITHVYLLSFRSQIAAQATKMYVEKLVIHPMKITLTFVQSPYPRKRGRGTLQATAINVLTSLAGVDRMQLKLKSFEVDDVLESRASLVDLIVNKTIQDLQSQLAQIAGTFTLNVLFVSVLLCALRSLS